MPIIRRISTSVCFVTYLSLHWKVNSLFDDDEKSSKSKQKPKRTNERTTSQQCDHSTGSGVPGKLGVMRSSGEFGKTKKAKSNNEKSTNPRNWLWNSGLTLPTVKRRQQIEVYFNNYLLDFSCFQYCLLDHFHRVQPQWNSHTGQWRRSLVEVHRSDEV